MAMEPGWYPDPFSNGGYVRWWDGERWGQSVTAPSGVATDPGAPVLLPPPPAPGASAAAHEASEAEGVPLADWGQRAAARIIDWAIESVLSAPFILWAMWPSVQTLVDAMTAGTSSTALQAALQQYFTDLTAARIPLAIVTIVVTFAYQVPQNVLFGRTLGKRVLGIRIRMKAIDQNPGWLTATIRWGTYTFGVLLLTSLFAVIDYLWPLWDRPWRQALHDKTARTIVVRARR
ncbi:MAG TPA: RDD family protein [Candidatus Nanopelagicales bacterium]|nr:RDD family protein [Candidatus Nanopelagicales bacterium]